MPAIRAAYTNHPVTSELGIWVAPSWAGPAGLVGLAATAFPVAPTSGSLTARKVAWGKAISDALTALCEIRVPLSSVAPSLAITPEPFCRVDGLDYVAQPIVVTVRIKSISPLVFGSDNPMEAGLEISDGACRMVRV